MDLGLSHEETRHKGGRGTSSPICVVWRLQERELFVEAGVKNRQSLGVQYYAVCGYLLSGASISEENAGGDGEIVDGNGED